MATTRFLFLLCLIPIAVDGAALQAKSAEAESLDNSIPPITSKSSPTLADLLNPTTSKPTTVKEQQIVEFFARHIDEVANISDRLAELEWVVGRQSDLIAMNKQSTQLWTQYLPWKASLASQNETLRAVGYFVERQLKDFHADVELAKADFEEAVEERAQCADLSGTHWKSVCDALERNVAKASAKLQRENARARSWQETASIVRRQKAVLDSVDTAQADGVLTRFHLTQRFAEVQLAIAAKSLSPDGNAQMPTVAEDLVKLLPHVDINYEIAPEPSIKTSAAENATATEEEPDMSSLGEILGTTSGEGTSTSVEGSEEATTSTPDDNDDDDDDCDGNACGPPLEAYVFPEQPIVKRPVPPGGAIFF